jgi:hypothetical protein
MESHPESFMGKPGQKIVLNVSDRLAMRNAQCVCLSVQVGDRVQYKQGRDLQTGTTVASLLFLLSMLVGG